LWFDYVNPITGKRVRKRATTDLRSEAKRLLQDELTDLRDDARLARRYGVAPFKAVPLSDLWDRYEADDRFKKLSPRSQEEYRTLAEKHLLPLLGTVRTDAITEERIGQLSSDLAKKGLGASRVALALAVLKVTLRAALAWHLLPKVPIFPRRAKRDPDAHFRILSREEEGRLLAAAKEGPEWLRPFVRTALSCGLRRNECIGLTWGQINTEKGTLLVDRQGPDGAPPKSKRERILPLPEEALRTLMAWGEQHPGKPDDRLFSITRSMVEKAFRKAVGRAGLGNVTIHDLRRTYGSRIAAHGGSGTVKALLGHGSIAVSDRYVAGVPEALKAAVEKANAG
jgi:integrase